MRYNVGQEICLWRLDIRTLGFVIVAKEVMVQITETKVGAPGEFSGIPSTLQSLKGIDGDGKIYSKHWDHWPESQTSDFSDVWTFVDDESGFWVPAEAIYIYNSVAMQNWRNGGGIVLRGMQGEPLFPKGDLEYCNEHDQYMYPSDDQCFVCCLEAIKLAKKV